MSAYKIGPYGAGGERGEQSAATSLEDATTQINVTAEFDSKTVSIQAGAELLNIGGDFSTLTQAGEEIVISAPLTSHPDLAKVTLTESEIVLYPTSGNNVNDAVWTGTVSGVLHFNDELDNSTVHFVAIPVDYYEPAILTMPGSQDATASANTAQTVENLDSVPRAA